jgi:hypothetical protein
MCLCVDDRLDVLCWCTLGADALIDAPRLWGENGATGYFEGEALKIGILERFSPKMRKIAQSK